MNRMVVKSKVGSDGIPHLDLPVGIEEADQEVQVTIEPVASKKTLSGLPSQTARSRPQLHCATRSLMRYGRTQAQSVSAVSSTTMVT